MALENQMKDAKENLPMLLLRFEGVLQSWGEHSSRYLRDTAEFPSKSGIVGMIGCVMGIGRDDIRLGKICDSIRVAVRADRPGTLTTDYQTKTADRLGKRQSPSATDISYREYLADASFLVIITLADNVSPEYADLLMRINDAFHHPVWTPYLGRKCCIPSVPLLPVYTEQYSSVNEALFCVPAAKRAVYPLTAEIDSPDGTGYSRSDVRLAQSERSFRTRRVTTICIPGPSNMGESDSINETD